MVVFNSSSTKTKDEYVLIDFELNKKKTVMDCLYGGLEAVPIYGHENPERNIRYVKLTLNPMQFVILKSH